MKKTADQDARKEEGLPVFPPFLREGATIGLAAPAGALINRDNFLAGVGILEKNGFRVKFNRKLLKAKGYLAGSDRLRADEFNSLWADPEVSALVAARGGYGCLRMVDLVDMQQIRRTPKILIGFSDLTVLLTAIHKKTGLVTYHGPVITTLAGITRESRQSFFDTLLGRAPARLTPGRIKVINGGHAKGILLGGNLTTLVHMIGTPHEIPWHDAILFLEDVGEMPYRIDRLLTHLSQAGRLRKIKGLILGTFTDENNKESSVILKTVYGRIAELFADRDIPIWANFPVGHVSRNLTLPIGVAAEMDSSKKILKFL